MLPEPTQSDAMKVLRAFLLNVLASDLSVVLGQGNRVPQSRDANSVVVTPLRRRRLETNRDSFEDAAFVGSIAGTVMTITDVLNGEVRVGAPVIGVGVLADTRVVSFGTGSGGAGTYNLNKSQNVSSEILQLGVGYYLQPVELTVQVDLFGPLSADYAQTFSTMMRDEYAVTFFEEKVAELDLASGSITPYYADDPQQMPFDTEQQQVQTRWTVQAGLQLNQIVTVPQQFAAEVDVGLVSVDATYPLT